MKFSLKYIILILLLIEFYPAYSCTTAIISGKFTIDGRPLLFKHRDTDKLQNKVMFFDDGKYEYMGLVNSGDSLGNEVWAGCNSAGFAIMNSANYNLNLRDTTSFIDREGFVMKQALQGCATLEDFEKLLSALPKPLGVNANFGVIDATGGAAYYETGNYTFVKFDANDPATAPYGYIIRTNYAYTGERRKEYGVIRFRTAQELFHTASLMQALDYKFLLQDVSRSLKHSLTKKDLRQDLPLNTKNTTFMDFNDFIPRYSSAATVVVQGVKKDESPSLTTMWTILGFQLSSVAIPTWLAGGGALPSLFSADNSGNAPLCDKSLKLKAKIFPLRRGSYRRYINLAVLMNQQNKGIMQKLQPLENLILNRAEEKLKIWRMKGIKHNQVQKFYEWVDKQVRETYKREFNL